MGYCFKPNCSVHDNVQRIVAEEVLSAAKALSKCKTAEQRDKSIHEARKTVKKLRALLRLLKPMLKAQFAVENRLLGDLGRSLGELRDAGANIQAFRDAADSKHTELEPAQAAKILRGLKSRKRAKEEAANPVAVMSNAADRFREFGERARAWKIKKDGLAALEPGLMATYKAGRRAYKRALKHGDADRLHQWRKRAKEHWYHVRLLDEVWKAAHPTREEDLHELESALGEDHNLHILWAELETDPDDFGGGDVVKGFRQAVENEQKRLRQKAAELGGKLYDRKSREVFAEFEGLWKAWQEDSEELVHSDVPSQ